MQRKPGLVTLTAVTVFLVGPLRQALKTAGWLRPTFSPRKCSRIRGFSSKCVRLSFAAVGRSSWPLETIK